MTVTGRPTGLTNRDVLVPLSLAVIFLTTRILIFLSLRVEAAAFVANDVGYYAFHLNKLALGERDIMLEYPVPTVWILQGLYWLGGGQATWTPVYVAFFLALDAVVAILLYRRDNALGTLFWILFTGVQGAILLHRFDLLPAALVAVASLYALRLPRLAGGAIGLGAAIKLWPALLIGPLLAPNPLRDPGARNRFIGFAVVGFGLAAASLVTSGWTRSASPIGWQGDRGLQIESVPATPLMVLRTFTHSQRWEIRLTEFNALEVVTGPGIGTLLTLSNYLTVASVLLTVFLSVRLVRNVTASDHRLHEAMLLAVLTVVLVTVVVNKTLSPQYVVWLGGPVAALLVVQRSDWLQRHVRVLAAALLVVGGLTQATYPWLAYGIMAMPQGSGPETAVLVLRNLALVCLAGYALWLTLRASRASAI